MNARQIALDYLKRTRVMSQYASLRALQAAEITERAAVIAALEAEIAQGVEPVGYFYKLDDQWRQACDPISFPVCTQLYTAPQEPVNAELLAALEKIEAWSSHTTEFSMDYGANGVRDFYRTIARAAIARVTGATT